MRRCPLTAFHFSKGNKFHEVLLLTFFSKGSKFHEVFLLASFSKESKSREVFLLTSFEKEVSREVFLLTSFSKEVSREVFLLASFSKGSKSCDVFFAYFLFQKKVGQLLALFMVRRISTPLSARQ